MFITAALGVQMSLLSWKCESFCSFRCLNNAPHSKPYDVIALPTFPLCSVVVRVLQSNVAVNMISDSNSDGVKEEKIEESLASLSALNIDSSRNILDM